ncbi:MAG TPA: histidine kinase N-terminal 7TM domain-containing protein [Anaerolineae bacterium]|nr:histidine kinase N-terminal 7TM domain-containing protein [Anaerolineae bacterium]
MSEFYVYTPAVWPPFAIALFTAVLALYSWQRRIVPGAQPFAVACLFATLWLAGIVFEVAAADVATKYTWIRFQTVWLLPAITAMTCFALEYAYPGRWLTRRNLILLSIAPVLSLLLILSNDLHHILWLDNSTDGSVLLLRGAGSWIFTVYTLSLVLVNTSVFGWLFIRSPQHRWPVALMLFGQITSRILYVLYIVTEDAAVWREPLVFVFAIPLAIYGIALFGFRIFDPLPAARAAAIEQMRDGMVVLDAQGRVLGLNAAAESILDAPADNARGKTLPELLPAYPDLPARLAGTEPGPAEIGLHTGAEARQYALNLTSLEDHRDLVVGYLLLLHDVTEQRQAQAQILAQRWAEATLQEREQLAYELHDGLSQGLAFLNLQAQTAQVYLQTGQDEGARANLARLIEVARDLQGDVRELIGNLLAVSLPSESFCSALRQTVARFEAQTGLSATLDIAGDEQAICDPARLSPATGVQLLRIVQEALTNVRKHADRPSRISVQIAVEAGQVHVVVEDNGAGFNMGQPGGAGDHFGLQVMRQRAAHCGGELVVHSAVGQGTRVEICLPLDAHHSQTPGYDLTPALPNAPMPREKEGTQYEDSPG